MGYALEMCGMTKSFPGVLANDRIDFQLAPGEIHALLGENGAGKTTLMHLLSGLSRPDAGEIVLRGRAVTLRSPLDAVTHGIGMVHQHFMLVPSLTVAENIILGQEVRRCGAFLDLPRASARIAALAQTYQLAMDPRAVVQELPLGVRQRVELVKALYRQAQILILDEPTAVLTPDETAQLFRLLTSLAQQGTSIIFITHKLAEVFQIAQRITVLRRGRVVATLRPQDTSEAHLAALMVGHSVPGHETALRPPPRPDMVLQVQDIQVLDDRGSLAVDGVSLCVHAGEILGLAGVQGNGQTELLESLTGLRRVQAGRVALRGVTVTNAPPRRLLAQGVGHIPEDRHAYGMLPQASLADNLVLNTAHHAPFARGIFRRRAAMRTHAQRLMQAFDIRAPSPQVRAGSLSGGNQQKMVVARELSRALTLLIAAQPTRGLDLGATQMIQQHLAQQRAQGCAVLLASTELDELCALADRIAVMYRGKIVATLEASTATREQLGQCMAGLTPHGSA